MACTPGLAVGLYLFSRLGGGATAGAIISYVALRGLPRTPAAPATEAEPELAATVAR